ncbi:MAG: outer membrane beta-barrel protein [Ignavibacteria bacterium]
MNFFFLICLLICFFTNNIFSQEKYYLGCKTGSTITYADYDFIKTEIGSNYEPFTKTTFGFNFSLFIEEYYSKNFSLILEVGYNQKGLRPIIKFEDNQYKLNSAAFNNIFLPFSGKYKFLIDDFNPFFSLGLKGEQTMGQAEGFMHFQKISKFFNRI